MSLIVRENPEPGLYKVCFDIEHAEYKSYNIDEDINEMKKLTTSAAMAMVYNNVSRYKINKEVSKNLFMPPCPAITGDLSESIVFPLGVMANLEVEMESMGGVIRFYSDVYINDDLVSFFLVNGVFKEVELLIGHVEDSRYIDISENYFDYDEIQPPLEQKIEKKGLYREAFERMGQSDQYLCIHGIFLSINTYSSDFREYAIESAVRSGKSVHKIKTKCRGNELSEVINKISTVTGGRDEER